MLWKAKRATHGDPRQNLPQQGLASEIVLTALQRAGYQADITIMPWSRVLPMLYQHQTDGVVAIWATNDRRSKPLFSDSYLSTWNWPGCAKTAPWARSWRAPNGNSRSRDAEALPTVSASALPKIG